MQDVIVVSENTTIPQTIAWIKRLTLQAAEHPEIKEVAKQALQSDNALKYIFDYSYDTILYEPNEGNKQQLRTVWNFLRTGRGNCTGYTELIGAVLLNAGIPFKYRVVNYPLVKESGEIIYPKDYQHVYIVTSDDTVLDPVIGHKQDGTDTRLNRPLMGQFNCELPYFKKIDFPMARLEILQGTLGRSGNPKLKSLITNRSKMVRYGLLNGCSCNDTLNGKVTVKNITYSGPQGQELANQLLKQVDAVNATQTKAGKFLEKAGNTVEDVGHFVANVVVAPVESITGKQIVGPNYNAKFFEKADKAYSGILEKAQEGAATILTAGLVDTSKIFKNPYDVQAAKEQKKQIEAAQKTQQQKSQQLFSLLNQPPTIQDPNLNITPPGGAQTAGGGLTMILILGSLGLGTYFFANDKKKGKRK